jgi:hypothetical protein
MMISTSYVLILCPYLAFQLMFHSSTKKIIHWESGLTNRYVASIILLVEGITAVLTEFMSFVAENGEKGHGQGRTVKHDEGEGKTFGGSRIYVGQKKGPDCMGNEV